MHARFIVRDLGLIPYPEAFALQRELLEQVIASRAGPGAPAGHVLLLEHPAVITRTPRAAAADHLLASPETLAREGVTLADTDRGGDITYHGPGQLVAYPILDLNRLGLGLHDYMRLLEQAVIDTCAEFGVHTVRDAGATGVWTRGPDGEPHAKVCAMGVRLRRWVSMHGLALNVSTNLRHFQFIVPCGLAGRPVTSLGALLGERTPNMAQAKSVLTRHLLSHLDASAARAPKQAGTT